MKNLNYFLSLFAQRAPSEPAQSEQKYIGELAQKIKVLSDTSAGEDLLKDLKAENGASNEKLFGD